MTEKIRIEVGYGLEGALTDALSSKIIRNDITPEFKSGRYYEGIDKELMQLFLLQRENTNRTKYK